MTDSGDTTMASSETTGAPFKAVTRPNKSKRLKATLEQKDPVERAHSCTIRTYFPPPRANAKFNPVANMQNILTELPKYEPSIVVVNPTTNAQIVLSTTPLPTNEDEFKKFFTITTDARATTNQQRVVIGCTLLSERTITEIKFDRTKPELLEWMKNQKIFVESDSLGVNKTTTIGYLTRLHPQLTNRNTLKALLNVALEDIYIDPKLATDLDPTLTDKHTEAMSNGDVFVPEVPPFEVYKTRITHGRDQTKIFTHVIGIKCAAPQAKLLKEFYSQLASPEGYEKQIGVFVPTGAVHLLGIENYVRLIRENNAFLDEVTTIPMGDFQHATLDIPFSMDPSTDIDQLTLTDLIADQPWCLSIDKTNLPNKVMLTTTKTQLQTARDWLDKTLPDLYNTHVADKLDVTTLARLIPRRLDKPTLTAASTAYATALKNRTSSGTTTTNNTKQFAKPPRLTKQRLVDISFDEKEFPALTPAKKPQPTTTVQATTASTNSTTASLSSTQQTPPYDYKAELDRISNEIENKLKKQFENLFVQMEKKLDKFITQYATQQADQANKLDNFMRQHADQKAEQDHFNEKVTKQLDYLITNLQRVLELAAPTPASTHPMLNGDGCA